MSSGIYKENQKLRRTDVNRLITFESRSFYADFFGDKKNKIC